MHLTLSFPILALLSATVFSSASGSSSIAGNIPVTIGLDPVGPSTSSSVSATTFVASSGTGSRATNQTRAPYALFLATECDNELGSESITFPGTEEEKAFNHQFKSFVCSAYNNSNSGPFNGSTSSVASSSISTTLGGNFGGNLTLVPAPTGV
ncbi:hypothetical protein B0H14DRAFT_2576532 [Mycena olivaceomarginata]|nr:hypothetical protein B0H14DRAFT_2576532 [Mycena olivaceomarginata]